MEGVGFFLQRKGKERKVMKAGGGQMGRSWTESAGCGEEGAIASEEDGREGQGFPGGQR